MPSISTLKLRFDIVAFSIVQHYFLQSVLAPPNLFSDCCIGLQCFLINSFDLLSLSLIFFSIPVIFLIRTSLQWRAQSLFEKGQVSFIALQSWEMNNYVELFSQGLRQKRGGCSLGWIHVFGTDWIINIYTWLGLSASAALLREFSSRSPTLF